MTPSRTLYQLKEEKKRGAFRVDWERLVCRHSHFVEEISSPDVALSRPGTYPNKRRRPPENEENREAPMALTTTGEGKERKHDPLQRIFPT